MHPDHDVADAPPGVEPAVERDDGGMAWCGAEGDEAYSGMKESAARVEHATRSRAPPAAATRVEW